LLIPADCVSLGRMPIIWNRRYETLSREELRLLQLERLQQVVKRVYHRVPYYRRRFDDAGVKPEEIESLSDIERLPFTTKEDLRVNSPFGLLATPLNRVVRLHASSGTTGKPAVAGYTKKDLQT